MQLTKTVQGIGNGGHVYLPKEMVGQKVQVTLVEKDMQEIEKDALQILKPHLKHIMGVYLYGSYARGEQTPESDIDILVITDANIKLNKRINEYDFVSGSLKQIEKTISNNAVLILPILKEATPVLNQGLIEGYKKEILTKKNTRGYIETTESALELAKDWIKDKDSRSIPNIVYPLIMRLRGLYIIESMVHNRKYSNKELINQIAKKGISIDKARQFYRMYREHRDNKAISDNALNYKDIAELYDVVYTYFGKVKLLWEKLR